MGTPSPREVWVLHPPQVLFPLPDDQCVRLEASGTAVAVTAVPPPPSA